MMRGPECRSRCALHGHKASGDSRVVIMEPQEHLLAPIESPNQLTP